MTTAAAPRTADRRRTATTLLALVVPLVVVAAGALLALSWADELPDPVASHWGTDGADGFMSLTATLVVMVVSVAGLAVLGWAITRWGNPDAMRRRVGVGTSVGLAVLVTVLVVGSLHLQRGLTDARDAPVVDPVLGLAFAAALVLGGVAALLTPGDPASPTTTPPPADATRLPLRATERAAWTTTVWSPTAFAIAGPVVLGTWVVALLMRSWVLLGIGLVVGTLVAVTLILRVTVDARGLDARSPLGWPRLRVPLDEVVTAGVEDVRPVPEFGGYGYRVGRDGRAGFVLRSGPALVVERTGGRRSVVTVEDAATAAALLNTLAERARA